MRPSKIVRELLLPYFPQNEDNFEKSEFPIYVDYSFAYEDMDTRRILILQSNGPAPNIFLGGNEIVRGSTCDIVVASPDADEAYMVSNIIFNRLRKVKNDYGILQIVPTTDIEPVGINSKRIYLYTCSYGILKED